VRWLPHSLPVVYATITSATITVVKLLNGSELAGYIKERQAHEVRSLRQSLHVQPKLAITVTVDHPAIDVYMRMKQRYGDDIGVLVDIHRIKQAEVAALVARLNDDPDVHGIIIQLPLADPSQTQALCDLVDPKKDVDGLGMGAVMDAATPMAILWLLAGYNVDMSGKKIVLVGRGKLVGAPLERMLKASGYDVESVDVNTPNIPEIVKTADIIVTATGTPRLITGDMVKRGAVVVDAGTASEQGKIVGDVSPELYERDDITITPTKGGVGPLTICALFENLIRASRQIKS